MTVLTNFPLIAAFASIIIAQVIKVPLYYFSNRKWNVGLCFSTGGMPSSHSAAVASLTTAIGIDSGAGSPMFAISVIFSVIIMFDAAGIRRHAGEQAVFLNRLIEEFHYLFKEMLSNQANIKLKELLGHRPSEVIFGALLGIAVSLVAQVLFF